MTLELPDTATCYFCDILREEPSHWSIWSENAETVTLLNGRQYEIGQSIVVPRRHVPTILDLDVAQLGAVMSAAQQAAAVMMEGLSPTGILLYQNNGVGSGQEVPHFHLHVVPRQAGSDWGLGPPHLAKLENAQAAAKVDHTIATPAKRDTARRLREKAEL